MPTNIRMYNCAFGDCFRISHVDDAEVSHLYVDFGIHRSCPNQHNWKQARYGEIIGDMPENSDFLLTHYHYDHYSGLLYMIRHSTYRFNNIYIPDIWNRDKSIDVIKLFLWKDVLTPTVLADGLSLIRFLLSICHASGKIYFISRGDPIQAQYVALWPTAQKVQRAADKVLRNIGGHHMIPEALEQIAEQLREIMLNISETNSNLEREQYLGTLTQMEDRLVEIAGEIEPDAANRRRLGEFAHSINIIFQNSNPEDRHILFTGDAEKSSRMWKFIEENTDHAVPFYEQYEVIKIPHHGTGPHYHDFSTISNENTTYLIPNGLIPEWPVDRQYSDNANIQNCAVYCSGKDACQAAAPRCNCTRGHIIP